MSVAKKGIIMHTIGNVRKQAIDGNVREQERLAQMYEIGKFLHQDSQQAKEWYFAAAMNGSSFAKNRLCRLLRDNNENKALSVLCRSK